MTDAWTDYPLFKEEHGKIAPIRKVHPLSYDFDKYVTVEFEGEVYSFKAGYLYSEPGRVGEVKNFPVNTLPETEYC